MMRDVRRRDRSFSGARSGGFTLLEIIIAVTMLAAFLLPMMLIVSESKIRAIRYTQQREVRDLAQRKLFDRVHYYEEADRGTFEIEGHPDWFWEIDPPEMIGSSEQVLLEYTIKVTIPQRLEGASAGSGGGTGGMGSGTSGTGGSSRGSGIDRGGSSSSEEGSTYQMNLWAFPDTRWYDDQQLIYDRGGYSPLYGSQNMSGGTY